MSLRCFFIFSEYNYLQQNVDNNDQEWVEKVEEEPNFHRFDGGGAGQGGGH